MMIIFANSNCKFILQTATVDLFYKQLLYIDFTNSEDINKLFPIGVFL